MTAKTGVSAPAERDPRTQILRLLGESATLRNKLAQADSYLAGLALERERLTREGEAHTADLKHLNTLPRTREIQERTNRNQNRRDVAELELNRLNREERKTRESQPRLQSHMEECERLRSELETARDHPARRCTAGREMK